jgi:site-specific DNA-methyltransferase (adenine-specific)
MGTAVWDKTTACRPTPNGFRAQTEYVQLGRAPGGTRTSMRAATYLDGVFRVPVERDKIHIAGKPVALMKELVAIAPTDGVVLDPFAGSGTTGVAALETGRRFLGCELVEHYHAIASARVGEHDVAA